MNNKRLLTVMGSVCLVLVLTALVLLAACSQPAPAAPATPATPTTPATPAPKVIEWVGQCPGQPGQNVYLDFVLLSERIERASNGRMKLTPQPTGAIVPGMKEFDGINDNVIQYASSPFGYWRDKFPAAGLFSSTVAGLSAMESVFWYLGGGGKELCAEMVQGYNVNVDYLNRASTAECFLWSTKPLKTVDDLKGLKMRTAGDDGAMFSEMGVAVVNIPGSEVYEAAQRGVIDAWQISSPKSDMDTSTHEVGKYLYLSPVRQALEFCPLLVNTSAWAELPDDLKEIVEAETNYAVNESFAKQIQDDIAAVEALKAYGTVVEEASPEIVAALIKQAEIYYAEQSAKDPFYAKVYNSRVDFMNKVRSTWPPRL